MKCCFKRSFQYCSLHSYYSVETTFWISKFFFLFTSSLMFIKYWHFWKIYFLSFPCCRLFFVHCTNMKGDNHVVLKLKFQHLSNCKMYTNFLVQSKRCSYETILFWTIYELKFLVTTLPFRSGAIWFASFKTFTYASSYIKVLG